MMDRLVTRPLHRIQRFSSDLAKFTQTHSEASLTFLLCAILISGVTILSPQKSQLPLILDTMRYKSWRLRKPTSHGMASSRNTFSSSLTALTYSGQQGGH